MELFIDYGLPKLSDWFITVESSGAGAWILFVLSAYSWDGYLTGVRRRSQANLHGMFQLPWVLVLGPGSVLVHIFSMKAHPCLGPYVLGMIEVAETCLPGTVYNLMRQIRV